MNKSHFFAQMARMNFINRWALMPNIKYENLSEHSLQVAMVAHMLALIENKYFNGKVNPFEVATVAMYHDASEVFTGDLPTPVKYQNSNIANEYKKLESLAEEKLLKMIPEEFQENFKKILLGSNIDPNIKKLVKDADTLCALIKCEEELKFNNNEFKSAADRLREQLQQRKANSPSLKYFEEIFLDSFSKSLDEISL